MIPALSPLVIPHAICYACGATMRPAMRQLANGKVTNLTLYCDTKTCQYGHEVSLQHVSGDSSVLYVAPSPVARPVAVFDNAAEAKSKASTPGPATAIAPPATPTSSPAMSEKPESKSGTAAPSDLLVAGK